AEMTQATDTLNCDHVSSTCTGITKRVERGDAGAEQRSSLIRRQIVRHGCNRFRLSNHVVSVSAVHAEAGDLAVGAADEVSLAAWVANEAVPAMPAYAYTLADFPQ